jgi:ribosomal protection tetracycline resistance protein
VSTLNLGIVAHVDAGKTSLTERLLFAAGVIDDIGRVDEGNTQTDTMALERQRGITIKSAVVSFAIGDLTVNLIDTPGHPDFIAEVERTLAVLDGAVLVISAVEGVQAQTRVLMRALRRLGLPTLIFVNKIDRGGARDERVLAEIREKLTPGIVSMGSVQGLGTRRAVFSPYGAGDAAFTARLADVLADHDDGFLAAYVDDETAMSYDRVRSGLAAVVRRGCVHPVFSGSAVTGAGVGPLTGGLREFLPAAAGNADGPVSGVIFKVERGPAGEKIAYARMFSGTVRTRDQLQFGGDREGRVTAISVFERGPAAPRACVTGGQIGKLWGLGAIRIGDTVGSGDTLGVGHTVGMGGTAGPGQAATPGRHFAPPSLETVVVPARPAERGALRAALGQLAEQDPLINVRQDDTRQEILLSLYGEVQKEVIQATLAADFGIDAGFRETTTICIERPAGVGTAVEFMGEPANPFRATVGLRIVPGQAGSGVRFRLGIERGALPPAFQKAVEETVDRTLRAGLHGWQVTDAVVTLTHSGFTPPPPSGWSKWSSSAGDFRNLTPLVLMSALRQAGTRVYEPVHRFHLEAPADTAWSVRPALARLGAVPDPPVTQGPLLTVSGDIPAARVHELTQQLPALTQGAGVLDATFGYYRLVRDPLSRSGGRSGSAGRRPPRRSSPSPTKPGGTAGT